ncbi:leukocyte elastase inhibitor-like [Paramacrobiotus metropolitanus]|uniref:leukocyte elastase inhibitor-like n=1 Tax=Paramacrobiotus metropolitanus TaxID=2943436 RepID=UPI0024460897|nr:leukocyte elastase inhibitor-like [Paramacrobiotus metropolitanus]
MDNTFTLASAGDFVAVDLYQSANCLYSGAGSYVLSPLSILYAGALLYFGANGPTKDNLNTALHFRTAFGNKSDILKGVFENTIKNLPEIGQLNDDPSSNMTTNRPHIGVKAPTEVALINGAFFQQSFRAKPAFAQDVSSILHGKIYDADFSAKNVKQAQQFINNWVTTNTFGRIKNMFPDKSIEKSSDFVLANTLYFRAAWQSHFPIPSMEKKPFYQLGGNITNTIYLEARRAIPYAEDKVLDVQYIELPYADDFYMLVILPRQKDGIRNCEHQINTQTLRDLRAKIPMLKAANQRLVNIMLPKFTIEGSFDLKKLLAKAGVTFAVGPDADFSNMVASGKPKLSATYHKVFFSVDEWGTEGAAVSEAPQAIQLASQAAWVPDYAPVDFTADHPFLFAVLHRPTESILFVGRFETV